MSSGVEITCPFCGKPTPKPADIFARSTACAACGRKILLEEMPTMAPTPVQTPASGEPMEGIRISGYRLVRLIGRGGMGEVYEAVQESLNRRVAVKVLPPHLAANESFVQRFNRESGALAKLSHPNIVGIYDCGREGEHYYFVLEFVTGPDGQVAPTLHQRLHSGVPLTVAECAGLIQEIAEALDYAHRKGVIHRDVKPSNVLIEERGHARLVDFGIAHLADGAAGEASRLTLTGDVLGTAGYLAPEQRQGRTAVDARADVYSCGAMLYEMLTGRIPEGLFELPTELVPTLDARWNGIIEKALQRNPDRRFQTMGEFLKALHSLGTAAPPPATSVAPSAPAPPPDGGREARPKTEAPFTPIVGKCVQCQTVNPGDNRFCTECGGSLYEPCLACQAENRVGTKYCGKCGTDMGKLKRVARYRHEVAGHLQRAEQMPGVAALPALDEAQATLVKLLTEQTDDAEARKTLAEVREKIRSLLVAKARSQQGSEAMATYRQALALFPADRVAQAGLDALQRQLTALLATASELVSKGEFQTALEQLDRAGADFRREADWLSLRDNANARWRAQLLAQARSQRKCDARAMYREILQRFPGDGEAQAGLSGIERELEGLAYACSTLIARKDFQAALNGLEEAQRQFGDEPSLLKLRAQARTGWVGALREEVCRLAEEHKFVTLRRRLEEIPEWAKPLEGERELREQAAQAIQKAEANTTHAGQLLAANKLGEAGQEYQKALGVCADYAQAKEGADRTGRALKATTARQTQRAIVLAVAAVVLVSVSLFVWSWLRDRKDWRRTEAAVKAVGADSAKLLQAYTQYLNDHPKGFGATAAHGAIARTMPANMALIPAGSFTTGDTFEEGNNQALPLDTVYVSAFYIEKCEVTKALWDEVCSWATTHGYSFGSNFSGAAANHPVQCDANNYSWSDCVKWCNARSEKEWRTPAYYTSAQQTKVYRSGYIEMQNEWVKWDRGYRLPTEAEWEKAARGGASGRRFPWSDANTITHIRANYESGSSRGDCIDCEVPIWDISPTRGRHPGFSATTLGTSPVGNFAPNGYGLYDMAGNVSEWCWDWYGSPFREKSASLQTDPRGPFEEKPKWGPHTRVHRGGSWFSSAWQCRVAHRGDWADSMEWELGFRCVLPPGQ